MIDQPEYSKESKRLGRGIILADGMKAEENQRRYLIRKTVEAWKNIDPRAAKAWVKMLKDLQDVDKGVRKEHGNSYTKLRLPRELWNSLRRVFEIYAADQEAFGTDDNDIRLLREEFPGLMPENARQNRGRRRRK